jgi:hypothetical protein
MKANVLYGMKKYDQSLPFFKKALAIVVTHEGTDSVRASAIETSIAGLYTNQVGVITLIPLIFPPFLVNVSLSCLC